MKITKEQLLKMERAARRQIQIESGVWYDPSGYHKTDKKSLAEKAKKKHSKNLKNHESDFFGIDRRFMI
jgi:hypothetical protein